MLTDNLINKNQQCIQTARSIVGCIRNSLINSTKEGIVPLYSALGKLHLKYCVQFLGSSLQDTELLQIAQGKAVKLIKD